MESNNNTPLALPDELIVQVLDHLVADDDSRYSRSSSSSFSSSSSRHLLSTLAAVSASSRKLHSIATPLLYRSAVLSDLCCTVHLDLDPDLDADHNLDLDLNHLDHGSPPPLPLRLPVLLSACASADTRLVRNLARAATSISISTSQAYLTARYLITSDCPQRHWPALFPAIPSSSPLFTATRCCYSTALHMASQYGHLDTVSALLELLAEEVGEEEEEEEDGTAIRATAAAAMEEVPSSPPPTIHAPKHILFTGTVSAFACPVLADALDAPVPMACLCPSRHLHALVRSDWGLGADAGLISSPSPTDWPLATPVMLAIAHGHASVAKLLIASGASWCVPALPYSSSRSLGGVTAAHMVSANCMADLAEWLVWWCGEQGAGQRLQQEQQQQLGPVNTNKEDDAQDGGSGLSSSPSLQLPLRRPPWRPNYTFLDWPDQQGRLAAHYAALSCLPRPVEAAAGSSPPPPPPGRRDIRRLLWALSSLGADLHGGHVHQIGTDLLEMVDDCKQEARRQSRELDRPRKRPSSSSCHHLLFSALLPSAGSILHLRKNPDSIWGDALRAVVRRWQMRHRVPLWLLGQSMRDKWGRMLGTSAEVAALSRKIKEVEDMDTGTGTGIEVGHTWMKQEVEVDAAFCQTYLDMLERDLTEVVELLMMEEEEENEVDVLSLAEQYGNTNMASELVQIQRQPCFDSR